MPKRKIIEIDEEKCTGCGLCAKGCPEGALKIIDGKAKLIGELLCDGLGACIGNCPEGALSVVEREAQPYEEKKVMVNIVKGGKNFIKAHLQHLHEHGQKKYMAQALEYLKEKGIPIPVLGTESGGHKEKCGCPGSMAMEIKRENRAKMRGECCHSESQFSNWPVQLKLINPEAPYFQEADLIVAADCVPFALADFHERFLSGKRLVVFCPKLDADAELYIDKLAEIIKNNSIKSVNAVHMEVPCCFGTEKLVEEAIKKSGKKVKFEKSVISIKGGIK